MCAVYELVRVPGVDYLAGNIWFQLLWSSFVDQTVKMMMKQ